MAELDDVCTLLDKVFLEYHTVLNQLVQARKAAHSDLGQGYFCFEEARLEKQCPSLGSENYQERPVLQAATKMLWTKSNLHKQKMVLNIQSSASLQKAHDEDEASETSWEGDEVKNSSLRRRALPQEDKHVHGIVAHESSKKPVQAGEAKCAESKLEECPTDPLQLFSRINIPPQIKDAQTYFSKSLENFAIVATCARELKSLKKEFQILYARKLVLSANT